MNTKELDLLCIGNALVDIFAGHNGQSFSSLGLDCPAQHIETEKLLRIISGLYGAPPPVITSGGGAANVAKIAGLLKAKVCFTGAIGRDNTNSLSADKYGRLFEKELAAAGVELKLHPKASPTGICLYLRAGEETRSAASPSAALELYESDISAEDIARSKVVLIDGFMLGRLGLVRHILDSAARNDTIAAIDLSSRAIAGRHAAEIVDFAKQYRLILFMNEAESEEFCKSLLSRKGAEIAEDAKEPKAESLPDSTLINLEFFKSLTAGKPFPIIVIKLEARGAVCFSSGAIQSAETQAVIPLESTGAGDAFCAGFLTAWTRNQTLSECADLGNKAARIILGVTGTQVEGKMFMLI